MTLEYLNKNNLHHAYLIEGAREEIVPEILKFVETLGVKTVGNPEFCHISTDSFKIDDARNLKSFGMEKGFTHGKKIFLISVNSFLLEAQNSLLKMFEEPIADTHLFVVVPEVNSLLKTFVSRFYLIRSGSNFEGELDDAEKFLKMSLKSRIEFIKELLAESEENTEEEFGSFAPIGAKLPNLDSARSKALRFLNGLESVLYNKWMLKMPFDTKFFEQIFKVREFLRMPGSSTKTLIESVAIIAPML